jgi:hypothetical protein
MKFIVNLYNEGRNMPRYCRVTTPKGFQKEVGESCAIKTAVDDQTGK